MSKSSSSSSDGPTSSSSSSSSADSGGGKPSPPRKQAERSKPSRADRDPGGHGGARREREAGLSREPASGGRREEGSRREERPRREEENARGRGGGARGRESLMSSRDEQHRSSRGSDRGRAEDDNGRDRYGSSRRREEDHHRGGAPPPQHRRSPGRDEDRRGGRDPRGTAREPRPRSRSRSMSPRRDSSTRHSRERPRSPRRRSRSPRRMSPRRRSPMPPPPPQMPREPRPDNRECFNCHQTGHLARDCPNASAEGGRGGGASGWPDTRECYKCHKTGHIAKDCPNARADESEGRDLQWGTAAEREEQEKTDPKDLPEPEPEFGLSGKLAEETNTVKGRVMKFQEPAEARKPTKRWRLYTFKNGEPIDEPMHIHRLPTYLFGRDRKVIDIPTDHPSCSKQHAVLCFRETEKEGADGMMKIAVRPYLMDLGSSNGTFLNGDKIEPERFYELLEQDNIKFGNSSRDYVLLHDNSADE